MSLSGNLTDFDLSFIFQIISQEKKTGKLLLEYQKNEAYIVFKNGDVISAGTNKNNIRTLILEYCTNIKNFSQNELHDLESLYKNDLSSLSSEVVNKQYISKEELSYLIETGLEDFSCAIFLWKNGSYRFDVLPKVDNFQINNIAMPSDAIAMEAARRMDELARFQEVINEKVVFVQTAPPSDKEQIRLQASPWEAILDYIFSTVDGTSSVKFICKNSFLTEYRIYEGLFELLKAKKIAPLPDKLSISVNAALERSIEKKWYNTYQIVFSSVITACIVALVIFSSNAFLRNYLLSDQISIQKQRSSEFNDIRALHKTNIASLRYHAENGFKLKNVKSLIQYKYISKRDLPSIPR